MAVEMRDRLGQLRHAVSCQGADLSLLIINMKSHLIVWAAVHTC